MRGKSRPSMNHQIIRTDSLSGILVVETGGKWVQNFEIMKIIIYIFKYEFLYLYFETFLSKAVRWEIGVMWRTPLLVQH